MPEDASKHADSIIIGAAEYSWPKLLNDYINGVPEKIYDNQEINSKDIPSPNRDVIPKRKYLKYPTVIANRGCKNNCEFCAISKMWQKCSPKPVQDVINEIKKLKSKIIVFFDPNFFGIREYSINLMKELEKLKIEWVGSATINVAFDTELMEYAKKSGCKGLLVGLESLNKESLKKSNKSFNDPNKYKEAIGIMQDYGISVNGCFVLGMDEDTEEELLSIPEQVNYLNLNLARFAILTPVPNSSLYNSFLEQGRIINTNWDDYTQHKAVFMPKNMSPERLEEIYKYVWKETYKLKNIITRVKNIPDKGIKEKLIGLGANIGFKYLGMD